MQLAEVAEGWRGCVALEPVAAGAVLLSVPAHLLMTCVSARRADARFEDAARTLRPAALLALHLLHEAHKGAASRWHAYVRTLPRLYTDGGGFSGAEAAALQAPHAVAALEQLRDERRGDWAAARPLFDVFTLPAKLRSFAAWSWAASAVSSRTVTVPNDGVTGGDEAGALAPVGDLLNHSSRDDGTSCGAGSFDAAAQAYCFRAQCSTPAGQQVFVSYGEHSNLELLLHYGFVMPSNAHDVAQLPRSPHFDSVALDDSELHVVCADGAPSWRLLAALRLAAAPPALRKHHGHAAASGCMLDLASEAAAFSRLRKALAAALAALPTTVEEDAALLSVQPAGTRMQLALQWRLLHKRALQRALRAADARLAEVAAAQRDATSCIIRAPA